MVLEARERGRAPGFWSLQKELSYHPLKTVFPELSVPFPLLVLRALLPRRFPALVSLVVNISSSRAEVGAVWLVVFPWCLETRAQQMVALLNTG